MRISKNLLALLFALILSAGIAGATYAAKVDKLLADADKAAAAVLTAKTSTDRQDAYKKALDDYTSVARKYPQTPQGALALYKEADVSVKMADAVRSTKEKSGYLYSAYTALTTLEGDYDKPADAFEDLEPTEIHQVQGTVADGKALMTQVSDALNTINSRTIQYKILDFFVALTGRVPAFSYWFAIVIITVIVKLLITPLTKKQFQSMKEMQKIAPLIKQVQERYKGDQKAIGEKTMELYKEHNINPFASCLPLLVQMPILMGLYYTIRSYQFQFAKGTFLWIGSGLSHLHGFHNPMRGDMVWLTARNMSEPDLILVLLYVVSMYISTKMSAVDPSQAEQQKMMSIMMPVMFAFLFASFPSAFLLYWLVFNILQTAQQYLILRRPGQDGGEAVIAEAPAPNPSDSGSTRVRRRRR